jgi:signal transduction histidine kinase
MTPTEYSPRARGDRVIASGRAFLALFALAGAILAPADPETLADEPFQLLFVYCIYALALWVATARGALVTRRATNVQHGIDLVVAVILTMLTRGSGSPFFLFFTFLLLAATVRWQAPGAWKTGLVVILAYVGDVTYEIMRHPDPIDLNRFVVRLGLLTVMTMVLGRLGAYQQRLYSELRQLAAWPRSAARTLDDVLAEALGYASRLLNGPVVILIWDDAEEERTHLAVYRDGRLERSAPTASVADLVPVPPDVRSFLQVRGSSGSRTIGLSDRGHEFPGPMLSADIADRYEVDTVIAAALPERSHRGWLLLINRAARTLTTDDVLLADIVAADISASLEHWNLSQRARDAAVAEERLRVSRDLHDGVLQSLTGCRLDIAAAAKKAEATSTEVAAQLQMLERGLSHDQQQLREVIQQLRGANIGRPPTPLRDLCARVERQWRIAVSLSADADQVVPPELNGPTLLMVHEALANAVRHGEATAAHVGIERRERALVIRIEDDGHGFPFKGRLQSAELAAMQIGPRSLRERAEMLGGTLVVASGDTGATVEISIPVTRETICA